MDAALSEIGLGLGAALGSGLLIGLERERRKGQGPQREAAGIRSFAIAALGGGIAQALQQPLLVALGALLVATLAALSYRRSLQPGAAQVEIDPGLTTELALFVTYLIGVLCLREPALGAAAAASVAALLAARERLHRFATHWLSQAELDDALLLSALALVLLPLLPSESPPALVAWTGAGGMSPRAVLLTMLLILALQGLGHFMLRLLGARAGLALSGLFSGFVSSTATIASMGARSRAEPDARNACLAGALLSTASTWLQVLALVAALAPRAWTALLPMASAGAAAALISALWPWMRGARQGPVEASAGAGPTQAASAGRAPLRLREAGLVALLLAAVSWGVAAAQVRFGDAGLFTGTALAALADAHAPVAALAALHDSNGVSTSLLLSAIWVAVAANSLTRSAAAWAAGGPRFAGAVSASLLASAGAAAASGALSSAWG